MSKTPCFFTATFVTRIVTHVNEITGSYGMPSTFPAQIDWPRYCFTHVRGEEGDWGFLKYGRRMGISMRTLFAGIILVSTLMLSGCGSSCQAGYTSSNGSCVPQAGYGYGTTGYGGYPGTTGQQPYYGGAPQQQPYYPGQTYPPQNGGYYGPH